jgi:hypothetical protein
MLRDTCSQQIRKQTGHNGWSQKIIEPFETLFEQSSIHIVEQIANVLHSDLEVFESQLKWQVSFD